MLMEFTQRKRPLIEICCCSTDDAMQAYLGGADRSVDIFQFSTLRAQNRAAAAIHSAGSTVDSVTRR